MALEIERYRFTVQEYEAMGRAGILAPDARVELLEGEVVAMTPIGRRHLLATARVTRAFNAYEAEALLLVQSPVRLGEHSELQPDVALVRLGIDDIPGPEDVLLLVEVADSSVEKDRRRKVPLYGQAGIREVWLLDLGRDLVEVYREPLPEGYRIMRLVRRSEHLAPEVFPDRLVAASDLLPEPESVPPTTVGK